MQFNISFDYGKLPPIKRHHYQEQMINFWEGNVCKGLVGLATLVVYNVC